ncbi:MAG TPA: P-II family nitrogen regulator [Polyangiaceae bacterium]|jgi:nitrogen regulatory protein P-II 1|nr:P-II family nitrogen regulator [Polyangiaceae bacterium]
MQRIEAIIRFSELDEVKEALDEVGITGMTLSEVRGFGLTRGRTPAYLCSAFAVDLMPQVKIEILATDGHVESILDAIERGAKTGRVGDGKIFVTNVPEVVRIRTGQHGEPAL